MGHVDDVIFMAFISCYLNYDSFRVRKMTHTRTETEDNLKA